MGEVGAVYTAIGTYGPQRYPPSPYPLDLRRELLRGRGCLMGERKGVEAPAGSTLHGVCSLNGGVLSSSSPFKQDPPAGEA